MFYNNGFFWGMHLIWWTIWFIFLWWIFFTPSSPSSTETKEDDLSTTLKIRFAKGEITQVEYEELKITLKSENEIKP